MLRGLVGGPLREIFGFTKQFNSRWVGHPILNRAGLHVARMVATDALLALRRAELVLAGRRVGHDELARFRRDGIVALPEFLPTKVFEAMRDEARARVAELPPPVRPIAPRGLRVEQPHAHGFDRFDGDTVNRYLTIDRARMPHTTDALHDHRFAALCSLATGFRHRIDRFRIYQTIHGDDRVNPDYQRRPHRDTFHSTIKLWLFLDDVPASAGPFMYSPGSHRMTPQRARWEHARAIAASSPEARDRGGAFRVDADGLAAMMVPVPRPYPVAANTLVLADVRGFHARGHAAAGAERLALYGNLRFWPFSPIAY